jgi:hypothetical protein
MVMIERGRTRDCVFTATNGTTYMAVVWLTASVIETIDFPASALLLPGGFGPTQHTLSNAHDNSTVWLSSGAPPPPKTRAKAWRLVWLRDTVPGPSTSAYVHETEYLNEVRTCGRHVTRVRACARVSEKEKRVCTWASAFAHQ